MSLCVKLAGSHVAAFEITLFRAGINLLLNYANLLYLRVPRHEWLGDRSSFPFLISRGFFGSSALLCGFFAIGRLQLGDATVLLFTVPMWTTLLAFFVLGEQFTLIDSLSMAGALTGVVLVLRPPFLFGDESGTLISSEPVGVVFAILSAWCSAGAYVSIRKLKGVHPNVVLHFFALFGVVASLLACLVTQSFSLQLEPVVWLMLLATGIFGTLGQVETTGVLRLRCISLTVFVCVWERKDGDFRRFIRRTTAHCHNPHTHLFTALLRVKKTRNQRGSEGK